MKEVTILLFQSLIGRLKTDVDGEFEVIGERFQSLIGRLKTKNKRGRDGKVKENFNPL